MLVLYDLTISQFILDMIIEIAQDQVVYVISGELYNYLRYTIKINVDMAYLKDNHIYLPTGEINDSIPVLGEDILVHVETEGINCDSGFLENHELAEDYF